MPHVQSGVTGEWLALLGSEIRRARIERGMTLSDVAERIGVSRYTVSAIEAGQPGVAIGTAFEAAAILGIPLMGQRQDLAQRTEMNRRIIDLMPRPASQQEEISNAKDVPEFF